MNNRRKVLFLDRDGVLNKDTHYLHDPAELEWVDGAKEALAQARQAGYELIVVTNQSGVARGYYTEEEVRYLHGCMQAELAACGAGVRAFYYCPYYEGAPVERYNRASRCRKPKPGMLVQAMEDFAVDRSRSLMIGDKPGDVEAAQAAGIRGYLFTGGNLAAFAAPLLSEEKGEDGAGENL